MWEDSTLGPDNGCLWV